MTIEEIKACLPHRYPFLLVDKVIEFNANESIKTVKNVTINEPFFVGHFPSEPIMPGVLIVESIAQSAGILAIKSLSSSSQKEIRRSVYFVSIEKAKFRQMVKPGDTLEHNVKLIKQRVNICKFSSESYVDGVLVTETEITAMVGV